MMVSKFLPICENITVIVISHFILHLYNNLNLFVFLPGEHLIRVDHILINLLHSEVLNIRNYTCGFSKQ